MCHVQRVTNSCGHINDHVLMSCYHAKDTEASPPPSPSPSPSPSPVLNQVQSRIKQIKTQPTERKKFMDGGNTSTAEEKDMIQRSGFDARTQPYCKLRIPKVLESPRGFKCMVHMCGVAD
ncbi:hypothetical protein BDV18DRAFT_156791 [Aspergillus unguis]